jgi:uncharacterized protein
MAAGAVRRDAPTAEFFDGTARGEFLLRRCADCGALGEPYLRLCRACESTRLERVSASGGGRVISWAVSHGRPDADGVRPRTVVAIAELDEGPHWWAEILDADPDELASRGLAPGQRVTISFEPVEDHEVVPAFRLA